MLLWLRPIMYPISMQSFQGVGILEHKIFGEIEDAEDSKLILSSLFNFSDEKETKVDLVVIDLFMHVQDNFDQETLKFLLQKARLTFPNALIFVFCFNNSLHFSDDEMRKLIAVPGNLDLEFIASLKDRKDEKDFVNAAIQDAAPTISLVSFEREKTVEDGVEYSIDLPMDFYEKGIKLIRDILKI